MELILIGVCVWCRLGEIMIVLWYLRGIMLAPGDACMQRTPADGEPGHEVLPNPSPCFGPLSGRGTLLMSLMARGSLLAVARSTVLLALIGQAAGFGVWTNGVSSARPTTRIAAAWESMGKACTPRYFPPTTAFRHCSVRVVYSLSLIHI